jgi:hypothetical protein
MPTLTATELELKVLAPVAFMDDADPSDDAEPDAEEVDEDEDEDEDEAEESDEAAV